MNELMKEQIYKWIWTHCCKCVFVFLIFFFQGKAYLVLMETGGEADTINDI